MNDSSGPEKGSLGAILAATSEGMLTKLQLIRQALDHAGEKGNATQDAVADFLNERLPLSLRATTGQVMGQTGRKSGQVDVIVYDATTTPMLFASSPLGGRHTVPAEGVLAVIEVKTKLTPKEIKSAVAHAQTVKTLKRDAYVARAVATKFHVYGKTWTPLPPILYSVFAFEGDGLYADLLNSEPHYELPPPEHRIDNIVVLDRGVCLSGELTLLDASGSVNPETRFLPTPTPISVMLDCQTPNALAAWYGMTLGYLAQLVGAGTIDITRYLQAELSLSGQYSQESPAARDVQVRAEEQIARAVGLEQGLVHRFTTGQKLSWPEIYDLVTNPHHSFKQPAGADANEMAILSDLVDTAKTMSKQEWLSYVAALLAKKESAGGATD